VSWWPSDSFGSHAVDDVSSAPCRTPVGTSSGSAWGLNGEDCAGAERELIA
jgi:hypothetical protein